MTMRRNRWVAATLAAGLMAGCSPAAPAEPGAATTTAAAGTGAGATGAGGTTAADPGATGQNPGTSDGRPADTPVGKPVRIAWPQRGEGRWVAAAASPATAGTRGRLMRYRVVVERGISGVSPEGFAAAAAATLADPRGWTGGGQWRFRRVGAGQPSDFTLYLATPRTRDRLCGDGPDGYTSCRNGAKVVLNVARWAGGVPGYRGALAAYRQYMVNHEVGHRLGDGHERCPRAGAVAPVMLQQTLGLHGCRPNPWPYPDGVRYRGPSGQYGR